MAIQTINSTDNGANSLVKINDNFTDLDTTKADLASPTFTGTITTPALKVTTSPTSGYILTSDASGNATWAANQGVITVETTSGTTHSLTTNGTQKVIVWAKGQMASDLSNTVNLAYDGVTKDTVSSQMQGGTPNTVPFSLMYTETPAAGTKNITVSTGSNVKIIVMKIG